MTAFYAICAVIGGTILVVQFVLTLIGMGDSDGALADLHHDVPHEGGDISDGSHDVEHHVHGSTWLFGIITFRTVVAAATFFGLAGLAADASQIEPLPALGVALAAGGAAMYGVFWMMQALYRLRSDGTVRLHHAVGRTGTVYVPIPPGRAGQGKIHLNLQNQTMELQAITTATAALPTGATIVVTGVLGPDTVEVAAAS